VTRVIGILECFEQLCKSLRSPAVSRWTTSFTRHAYLLKRFVSQQNFFKKKFGGRNSSGAQVGILGSTLRRISGGDSGVTPITAL
jgi:hypothetical protein